MPMRNYKCNECETIESFFDSEDNRSCPHCGSSNLKRLISLPLQSKNVETTDKYYNIQSEVGIQEDLTKRSKKHVQDTLDEMIDEFGENIAKEQGWIVSDDGGRTFRKRNDFDVGTINSSNSGTIKKETKNG